VIELLLLYLHKALLTSGADLIGNGSIHPELLGERPVGWPAGRTRTQRSSSETEKRRKRHDGSRLRRLARSVTAIAKG
jgi:hypothetical protein